MTLTTIAEPAAEPVSRDEVREAARVDAAEADSYLDGLIVAARRHVEAFTRRRLITQTVRLTCDGFRPLHPLPVAPVQSVSAVTYLDGAGATQTLASSAYRLVASREPPALSAVYGTTWPPVRADHDAVAIDLVVGYGDAGSDVPADIRLAMQHLIAHWYDNREAVAVGGAVAMPLSVRDLLMPHVVWL